MMGELANHVWQSTVFAVAAAIVAIALRRQQARVRYGLWLTASLKFLVPFAPLIDAGGRLAWPASAPAIARSVSAAAAQASEPFVIDAFPMTVASNPSTLLIPNWPVVALIGIWLCGLIAVASARGRTWRRVRAVVRGSAPAATPDGPTAGDVEVRTADTLIEPAIVGLFRPVLLLPAGIASHLTRAQLDAVIAHEVCHARRRDNLTAAIHMVVEALFWFHPLVWWIGARLVEERERACDEEVLRVTGEPLVYAEGIVSVCRCYVDARLACVSGVGGADLRRRIEAIMTNRIGRELTAGGRIGLALAAAAALTAPVIAGAMRSGQAASGARPRYEVAALKLCDASGLPPGARGGGPGPGGDAPGRLTMNCQTVRGMVQAAYLMFGDGKGMAKPPLPSIEGGPSWITSDRYTIVAKADGPAEPAMLRGPMLQMFLEERFNLKVHRETRGADVYALIVGKGGSKLKPFVDGSCVDRRPTIPPTPPPPLDAGQHYCAGFTRVVGTNLVLDAEGITTDDLARLFLGIAAADRPVIDRTGLKGRFVVHLEYAPSETFRARISADRGADFGEPTAAEIFTAVQEQLGLKLEAARGTQDVLVIDRVDRPTVN